MMRYASLALLIFSCLGLAAHFCLAFYGYFGFDDLYYAELAAGLMNGVVDPADHYSYRILPLVLMGLSYSVFGVNDFASALPTLLVSVGILYAFYRIFRREPWAMALAFGLYFSLKWNLFYADKPMPDLYVSAGCFAAWLIYVRWKKRPENTGGWEGALMVLSLFLAFNAKGTVLLIAPLLLVYLIVDLTKARYRFWLGSVLAGGVLLSAYLLITYWLTGDALARFSAIEGNHYLNPCSYDQGTWAYLIERLTNGFLGLLVETRLFLHAIVAAIVGGLLLKKEGHLNTEERFFIGTIFLCFGIMNFMTISTSSYNPVCLDARHVLLFSPILTVCSVRLVQALLSEGVKRMKPGYLFGGAVVAALALAYPAYCLAVYSTTLEYAAVKKEYREVVAALPGSALIHGTEVVKNYGKYYAGFGEGSGRFRVNADLPTCAELNSGPPIYVIKNWYMDWHAEATSLPLDSLLAAKRLRLVASGVGVDKFEVFEVRCQGGGKGY